MSGLMEEILPGSAEIQTIQAAPGLAEPGSGLIRGRLASFPRSGTASSLRRNLSE
jgi:hypothetical protein